MGAATSPADDRRDWRANGIPPRTVDGERLIAVFTGLVEPIGRSLPPTSEVVLHDLSLLPNSIVAVYGDVTGRGVGDPATNLLLEHLMSGADDHVIDYETTLPDGRTLRSSTMIIKDVAGTPVAALCVNTDVSEWQTVSRIAEAMVSGSFPFPGQPLPPPGHPGPRGTRPEVFAHSVDELASVLIERAIAEAGVPVELMRKEHKRGVVERLRERGLFLIKDGVEMAAEALSVTRFTIYNYLNEIAGAGGDPAGKRQQGKAPRRKESLGPPARPRRPGRL